MEDIDELLADVSNSEAYKVLDDLVEGGKIEPEKAEYGKEKYDGIHRAFVEAMSNEKQILDEAKSLKRRLEEEQENQRLADQSGETDDSQALIVLREDVEQAEGESALAQEREQLLQLEVTELQRQRNELQLRVDEITEEHRQALLPQIEELKKEILEIEQEVFIDRDRCLGAEHDLNDFEKNISEIEAQKRALIKEKENEKGNLSKASQVPEKNRRQNDIISSALKTLSSRNDGMMSRLKEQEAAVTALNLKQRGVEEEHSRIVTALDRGHIAIEEKEHAIDDLEKDVGMAVVEQQRYLADRAHVDMELKSKHDALRRESDRALRCTKEKDSALQKVKEAEQALKTVQGQVPPLKNSKDHLGNEKHLVQAERKRLASAIEELKREEDVCMSAYLKEESIGKEKAALFRLTYEEVSAFEKEVEELKSEETERNRVVQKLGSQRDRMTRMVSLKASKLRETREKVQLKDLVILDLKNVRKETYKRVWDFQQLYDLVKNQRNKFVNLIQAAKQGIEEMKDKLKILGNELEILRNESGEKDKLLVQAKANHQASIQERDTLRGELNQEGVKFRNRQSEVEEQIARIDKLNVIVNQTEKDMLAMKRDYENVVQNRNYTGIMLIDRNDELCILYEKANVQEEVLKQGELELKRREDEMRVYDLEIREVRRSIAHVRKVMHEIPGLDDNVALLQKEVLETRRESEALSLSLESPENAARWRKLEGKPPNKEELSAKVRQLEERVNDKKERLLEKELVLEEIGTLSNRLRKQAAQGKGDTQELAVAVNAYQNKISATTRKMMAIVSELSMYQASALKLSKEKEDLETAVQEAHRRLASGEPPTDDAKGEWERMQRMEETIARLAQEKKEIEGILDGGELDDSASLTRPNAYIPEELGIPKPYGSHRPFKPTEAGSTMRHIRKPEPRQIVI